jgi:hypothetical protein
MGGRVWRLNPSDFAFLWEECKRCFYLKVLKDFQRPRTPMPKIFMNIDSQMKQFFAGKRTEDLLMCLPSGVVEYGEKWVESTPIALPGRASMCFIRGKLDTVLKLDDGSYAIVDFKTSERKSEHIPLYGRQLHAYAIALENAAPRRLGLKPVTRMGLLVFEPEAFSNDTRGVASFAGSMNWIEIPRNDGEFQAFLGEVLDVLEQASPPGGSPSCEWCNYRDIGRRTGL